MTNEEIIQELKMLRNDASEYIPEAVSTVEALDKALKIIELKSSEDCVKREDIKSGMFKYGFLAPDMTVTEFVEDLPSVTPARPHGDREETVVLTSI